MPGHHPPRASRYFAGLLGGSKLAFGAALRREQYSIRAGAPGSHIDADGVGQGGNAGSQGFPGFQPADVTNQSRRSHALSAALAPTPTAGVTTQVALRRERYSDFGSATNGKLAASVKLSPALMLRGAAGTGFRAPRPQQVHFSSTFTDFISGVPLDVVLAPNGGAIVNPVGIPKRTQEEGRNLILGATFKPDTAWAMTADAYRIAIAIVITDRIVLSGRFDDRNDPALGTILQQLGVGQAQFFVNSVDTTTTGLDLTVSHKGKLAGGHLNTCLAFHHSKAKGGAAHAPAALAGFEDVLLSERERLLVEQAPPTRQVTPGFMYAAGAWTSDLKIIHFGPQTLGTVSGTAGGVPNARCKAKTSADLAFSVALAKNLRLSFGGNNIFNVKPTEQDADETDNGFICDSVQFGLNGASYVGRVHVTIWQGALCFAGQTGHHHGAVLEPPRFANAAEHPAWEELPHPDLLIKPAAAGQWVLQPLSLGDTWHIRPLDSRRRHHPAATMPASTPQPTALTLHQASRVLEVGFDDGQVFRIPFELMRVYSPSAEVQGHGPGQETLQTGKREVGISNIEMVGHYAVQPTFTDGHDTGLFAWGYLYKLGSEQADLWARYEQRLAEAGLHRDAPMPAKSGGACASH